MYMDFTAQVWFDDFSLRIYGSSSSFASDYNMLTNSSFEVDADGSKWPDNWNKAHDSKAGTYDIAWIGAAESGVLPYTGSKMVRIRNTPSWVTLGNNNFERLKAGSTYTATAMAMADKVTSGGAAIKFDVYSESTLIGQYRSETLIGTTDWQKLSVSYSTEEIKSQYPTATHIQYVAQARGATAGTIYFDAMRMSEKATVTNYSYDTAGNYLQDITNPLGKKVTLTVDKHGNPLSVTDPKQNVTKFTYDGHDRLATVQYLYEQAGQMLVFSYDKNSNRTSVVHKTGNLADPDNMTLQTRFSYSYEYDALNRATRVMLPNGRTVNYTYNPVSQATSIGNSQVSTTKYSLRLHWPQHCSYGGYLRYQQLHL